MQPYQAYPHPYQPPLPPPKKTNVALIVSLAVGIPVLLILCCVGVFVVGPIVGIGFFTSKVVEEQGQLKVAGGDWTSEDGSVHADISDYGTLTVTFAAPLESAMCGATLVPAGGTAFTITFRSVPCGPVTGTTGRFEVSGGDGTFSAPGVNAVVLHK
ncbi:hypothetical protein [Dactylosporangium sp. NPDC049140]|uniref:hypothetical protein n=1 Tax=Dactylosporangium sp. NPDC049140 TaxID=3155647 RepID=UPI00340EC6C7